jgi:hypothetical protein
MITAIILGVDRILDMCRTVLNVTCNLTRRHLHRPLRGLQASGTQRLRSEVRSRRSDHQYSALGVRRFPPSFIRLSIPTAIARRWFEVMRSCGDDVRDLLFDGWSSHRLYRRRGLRLFRLEPPGPLSPFSRRLKPPTSATRLTVSRGKPTIMKRIYEWITKANQVLLFFLIIGAAVGISYLFYDLYRTRHIFDAPSIPIAQSAEEAKTTVTEDVRFLDEYDGVYVFGIMKRMILDETARRRLLSGSLGNEETPYPGQMVNVIFSRAEPPIRKLLQNDGLILSHSIAKHTSEKLKASVFLCVVEDTNRDRRLDENDRKDLYVLAESLDKPDLIIKGGSEQRLISPTHLIVKTTESDGIHFWDVDIETQAKKEIAWK